MVYLWLVPVVTVISFLLTAALRRYALARSIIDIPNARSSHTIPTPRGGGVAIVLTFLASIPVFGSFEMVPWQQLIAVGGAGAAVAVIGFMDDHGHIAARWRLLGHFGAGVWALAWLGGLPPITLFGTHLNLYWVGHFLAAVYLVWLLNLYNFMDGIDGIASVEALSACLGACLLYWLIDAQELIWGPAMLAAAVVGFLCWNFPPARIFMGDAGSGFLGITLGVMSLQAAWISPKLMWAWVILLGVFIVDATFTLIRRLLRGDKVYEAHRSHAYQFASRRFGKHLPVTLAVGAINLFWLLPVAFAVTRLGLDGAWGVLISYVPLIILAFKFHAGKLETP
ncbi:glycosyltransferase family 4 protein [Pseudomonas sp. REP124]|uniref:MraY family glycosyltransferase n=1 Tax=Pseudomonas sp. REP124 TaxID=2875731 RepID=UPI001CCDD799|nr:glycosyltransferase family 4 protein [Pseudomonas sp. REP124]MBZ9782636.1 glycosyltransferase family 4 protein [Pseudomonas sp. REP124]